MKQKLLLLGVLGLVISYGNTLPTDKSLKSTKGEVVKTDVVDVKGKEYALADGSKVVIQKSLASGKYVKKDLKSVEEGLDKSVKPLVEKKVLSEIDENYLIRNRESIKKEINSREMGLSDKKLLSGKKDAIKKISTKFDYYNDSIYEVYSTPDFMTVIKFNSDEQIIHVAGGDTENWNIEQTVGGEGNSTYLYVMPVDTDLVTNLSVITNKRAYLFTLYSSDYTFNPFVRFDYPLDKTTMSYGEKVVGGVQKGEVINNVVVANNGENKVVSKAGDGVIRVNSLGELDFDYLVSDGKYAFTPTRVYSDNRQTILEFVEDIVEMPVLFVEDGNGNFEVVNYKYEDHRIIIDRKVSKMALKLGEKTVYVKHR